MNKALNFFCLSFILINLNGLFALSLGYEGLLSIPYLISLLLILIKKKFVVNLDQVLFLSFLIFYLCWSLFIIVVSPENLHENTSVLKGVRTMIGSILTFVWAISYFKDNGINAFQNILLLSLVMNLVIIATGLESNYTDLGDKIQGSRHGGIFGNPNELGFFSNFGFLIFLLHKENSARFYLALVVCPVLSFLTFSKTSIIVTALLLVLLIFKRSKKWLFVVLLVLLQFGSSDWTSSLNLDSEQTRRFNLIGRLISGEINAETTSERSVLFSEGMKRIRASSFLGSGFGSFQRLKGIGLGIHNGYLLILGEGGIPVFLVFSIFSTKLAITVYRKTKSLLILMSVSICVFILGILPSHDIFENKQFILFIAAVIYYVNNVWNSRRILQE